MQVENRTSSVKLACILEGKSFDQSFGITIGLNDTVDVLKQKIKKWLAPALDTVSIMDIHIFQDTLHITDSVASPSGQAKKILGFQSISEYWPVQPTHRNTIDVVISEILFLLHGHGYIEIVA